MALVVVLHRVRSPYVLPALLLAVPVAFHGVLLVAGVSLDQAREAGWVTKPEVWGGGVGVWGRVRQGAARWQ